MAKFGRWVYRDGEWEEGQASPENLREDLRQLPSDMVTKDIGDADKIHEEDPDYIQADLLAKQEKANLAKDTSLSALEGLKRLPLGEKVPLNQERVDVIIGWVIFGFIRNALEAVERGKDVDLEQVFHLWFPSDNANIYELKHGNPPSDIDRPKHLRGYRLGFTIVDPPKRILDIMEASGYGMMNIIQTYQENKKYIEHRGMSTILEATYG